MEESQTYNETGVTVFEGQIPAIADDVLDRIEDMAEDVTLWVKPTAQGFAMGEEISKELIGVITKVNSYFVKWTDGQPDKLFDVPNNDPPVGYEPRADVKVLTNEGLELGISLAKSSFLYGLAPYLKALRQMGLQPTQALTRFYCKEAKGKHGVFTVVRMSLIGRANSEAVPAKQVEEVTQYDERGDRIPY